MTKPIRLAVVGGGRGSNFTNILASLSDLITLSAVCDSNTEVLERWKEEYGSIPAYNDYSLLLQDPNVDAVFLATPLFLHAGQAVEALHAGKHVLSEVIAAHTLEDGLKLIETVKSTGLTYMMAENYCYMRPNLMVLNMIENGLFGEITHVEGGYIHDCRELTHYPDGSLTWRGRLIQNYNGNVYPTHSLGPIAKWLGINREDGDRLVALNSLNSPRFATGDYFKEKFGSQHDAADRSYWQLGDTSVTQIVTAQGKLITLKFDMQSNRPHNMTHYALQGTKGAYLSPRFEGEPPLVWIEGKSVGSSSDGSAQWQSLWDFAEEWEHPLWKNLGSDALHAGHGGGDYFVLREFAEAIQEGRKPEIDVLDAAVWSSVFPLSVESVAGGGKMVTFPDWVEGVIK